MGWLIFALFLIGVIAVAIHDVLQVKDPILRNYPVVGHGRHHAFGTRPQTATVHRRGQ